MGEFALSMMRERKPELRIFYNVPTKLGLQRKGGFWQMFTQVLIERLTSLLFVNVNEKYNVQCSSVLCIDTELEDSIRVQPLGPPPPTNLSVFPLGKPDYKDEISETNVVTGSRKTLADDIEALEFALVKDDNIQKEVADVTRICHDECVRIEGISCRKVVSPYRKLSGGMNLHSIGEVNSDEVVSPYRNRSSRLSPSSDPLAAPPPRCLVAGDACRLA
ncbi:hypothetical protein Dimus_020390 [Dionaea muscipula]